MLKNEYFMESYSSIENRQVDKNRQMDRQRQKQIEPGSFETNVNLLITKKSRNLQKVRGERYYRQTYR